MSGDARDGARVRVGFQRSTPPFSYAPTADFSPVGYSVDLARLVLATVLGTPHTAPPLEAVEVTSSTREALLARHRIDIECGSTTITQARARRCAFSRPIFRTSHRIAVKPGVKVTAGGLHVVGIQGSTSQAALETRTDLGFDWTFVGVASIGEARDVFLDDPRVGAMVADEVILRALLRGGGTPEGIRLLDTRLGGEFYGFMMRRHDQEFVRAVDDALAEVFASDAYPRLLQSWFVDELPGLGFGLGMDPADDAFVRRERQAGDHPADRKRRLR
ncbi:transporter substrate-binding domain-containing protein [Streptomyces sp. NL15-2K]|uniref:transporter substrate-binding domain-containing protein n=1 Tax=Streptomyces sp. NL15-2K TaxID=376149 RepID=UPI000F56430E|nr:MULTISPECIES: transporter substrate-binding domain-containing protein [Actinomycetes]WKX12615.1 transporter substrate-binding domain-containing protein [Kutzneria buriramensis]GCB43181.1 glutamate aspartate periplasmic binding protein precursor gltI [Streptomyces sp. NL15-2K]